MPTIDSNNNSSPQFNVLTLRSPIQQTQTQEQEEKQQINAESHDHQQKQDEATQTPNKQYQNKQQQQHSSPRQISNAATSPLQSPPPPPPSDSPSNDRRHNSHQSPDPQSPVQLNVNPLHKYHQILQQQRTNSSSSIKPTEPIAPPHSSYEMQQTNQLLPKINNTSLSTISTSQQAAMQIQSHPNNFMSSNNQITPLSNNTIISSQSSSNDQSQQFLIQQLQSQLQCQQIQIAAQQTIIQLQESSLSQHTGIPTQSLSMWRSAIQHCTTKSHTLQLQLQQQQQQHQEELQRIRSENDQRLQIQQSHSSTLLQQQRLASQAELNALNASNTIETQQRITQLKTEHQKELQTIHQTHTNQTVQFRSIVHEFAKQSQIQSNDLQSQFQSNVQQRLIAYSKRLSFLTQRTNVLLTL
jgi:hypothetical protein